MSGNLIDRALIRQFAFDIVMTELGGDDQDSDDQEYVTENVDAWMEHWDKISQGRVADPDTLTISKVDGRKVWACYSTTYRGDKRPSVLAGFLYTDDGSVCKHDHPDKGCGPVIVLDALLEGPK